ncbi:MAG: histone H1 [Solirubrobacteraceae bacterium]
MADFSQLAHRVVQATIDATEPSEPDADGPQTPAQVNGRTGGRKGGPARAAKLTPEQRSEIARKAARARWNGTASSQSRTRS